MRVESSRNRPYGDPIVLQHERESLLRVCLCEVLALEDHRDRLACLRRLLLYPLVDASRLGVLQGHDKLSPLHSSFTCGPAHVCTS